MGRLIDEDPIYVMGYNRGFKNAIKASSSKADYENRLKADMVAMLTEIQLEIEEMQGKYSPYYDEASQHTSELIQQKIDELNGE